MRKQIEITGKELLDHDEGPNGALPYIFKRIAEAGAIKMKVTDNSTEIVADFFPGLQIMTWYDHKRDVSIWEFEIADA